MLRIARRGMRSIVRAACATLWRSRAAFDMVGFLSPAFLPDRKSSAARAASCAKMKKTPEGGSRRGFDGGDRVPSAGKDPVELLLDLVFLRLRGHGDLLDQQRTRRVQHLALAERQLLVALEPLQIPQHLGDLEHRAGLDLL